MELMYALMVMMKYDDMVQMNIVELNALYFWVRITKVPSLFEELDTIKDIASSNGNFIQLDEKVFENIGRVRVRISYELAKHVFQKKHMNVETISDFIPNLVGNATSAIVSARENQPPPSFADLANSSWVRKSFTSTLWSLATSTPESRPPLVT
ncbi:hypothetical protein ACLB2K_022036 [Fragaria x ananassa]